MNLSRLWVQMECETRTNKMNPTPEEHRELTRMAGFVVYQHKKVRATSRPDPLDLALVGGAILTGKLYLRHGAFSWWVSEYCGMSPRTGRRYMERFRDNLEAKGWSYEAVLEDLKDLRESLARRAKAAAQEKD